MRKVVATRVVVGLVAVIAAGATPSSTAAAPDISHYRISGTGLVDPGLSLGSSFVVDGQGVEHVVGFVDDGTGRKSLTQLTRAGTAGTWTKATTDFSTPSYDPEQVWTVLSTDGQHLDVFMNTCSGAYSTSAPIGDATLPAPQPVGPASDCTTGGLPVSIEDAVAVPHGRAMLLTDRYSASGHLLMVGRPGGSFAAVRHQPQAPHYFPYDIVRDPTSGEIVMAAAKRGKHTPGPVGVAVWRARPGHGWSRRQLIPTTKGRHFVIDSMVADRGRVTIALESRRASTRPLTTVTRKIDGTWSRVTPVPGTHGKGFLLQVATDPATGDLVAAYEHLVGRCTAGCGIKVRVRHHGSWSASHLLTRGDNDQPLQLALTPSAEPAVAYDREAAV